MFSVPIFIFLLLVVVSTIAFLSYSTQSPSSRKPQASNGMAIGLIGLLIILLVLLLVYVYRSPTSGEHFHFTVSPQRTKCLLEQVLPVPRTPECCGKGTVGGYPPYYDQWLEPPAMKRTETTYSPTPDYVPHQYCADFQNEQLFKELNEPYTPTTSTNFVYYFQHLPSTYNADPYLEKKGFELHRRKSQKQMYSDN